MVGIFPGVTFPGGAVSRGGLFRGRVLSLLGGSLFEGNFPHSADYMLTCQISD